MAFLENEDGWAVKPARLLPDRWAMTGGVIRHTCASGSETFMFIRPGFDEVECPNPECPEPIPKWALAAVRGWWLWL